jgi:autotransporter-associated beta strand protein
MKNQPNTNSFSRLMAAITASLALAAGMANVNAADRTWNGGGDGVNWSDANNWGGTAIAPNDSLFFNGGTGLAPNNDTAAGTVYGGLTFNPGAGAFALGGSAIKLGGGITNSSANAQVVNFAINNNGANRAYDAAANDLTLAGQITGNNLIKEGTHAVVLAGTTGNSSLGATVNNGLLIASNSAGIVFSSPVTINTNGTLRLAGAVTDQIHYNQRVTLNGGVFQIQSSKEEFASLSGASATSIVENGDTAHSPSLMQIGGGSNHRGIYSGMIRDGAAGVLNVQVYRGGNIEQFNGRNSYSGTTIVQGSSSTGGAGLIVNGVHTGGGDYTVYGANSTQPGMLAGSGVISATVVNLNANSVLAPGGGLSADGTDAAVYNDTPGILTFSNAVNLTTATATLLMQVNGVTPGLDYDQVNIAGAGSFSNNAANLNLAFGYTPAAGSQFTLVQVQGADPASNAGQFATLNGVTADLSQGATNTVGAVSFRISYRAEGSTFDAGGNNVMIEILSFAGPQLTWRGNGMDNNWDIGVTADWDTNGPSLTTYADGSQVTFDDAGSNNVPVNLADAVTPTVMTVNASKDYVLAGAGRLTGAVVLIKTNTGVFTMVTDNDNTNGTTVVYQGTLQVGTNSTTGNLAGTIDVETNGVLVHSRADDVTFGGALTGAGAFVHAGSGKLTLTGASPFNGQTTNAGGTLQLGDADLALDGSIAGDIHVNGDTTLRYYENNSSVTINNTLSGTGTVVYDAAPFLASKYTTTSALVNSNFAGTNMIGANVVLHAADGNSGYALGNGGEVDVTAGGNEVWLDRSATPYNQSFVLAGTGWTGDATPLGAMRIFGCTVSGPVTFAGDTRIGGSINGGTISGPISGGSYQLEVFGNANSFVLSLGNSANAWGNTLVTSGVIRSLANGSISTNAMTIDANGELDAYGTSVTVNSLNNGGSGAGVVYNNSPLTNGTVIVGADDSSSSFDGVFGNGASQPLNLTKVGAGTLTLSAVSTNTGTVAVNGGTLALTGSGSFGNATVIAIGGGAFYDVSAAGGSLTLNGGQTLTGSGTLNGSLTASANSIVNPGDAIGTLSINGNAALSGTLLLELNRDNAPASNDTLVVTGTLAAGGTLKVVNAGSALHAGDIFHLFPAGVSGFTVNLPATDANGYQYTWNDQIASSGYVQVLTAAPAVTGSLFRTVASGNWSDPGIWQRSTNGVDWLAATVAPNYQASNIVVQTGNTVTNAADVIVDQVTVQPNATVLVTTGNFIITNGIEAADCLVNGTLQIGTGTANLALAAGAGLSFGSGGQFDWNRAAAPAIPAGTWQDGSTCRVSATASSTVTCAGISGQSYYDFVWDTTMAGQSSRSRLNLQGTATTMRHDFIITLPDTSGASVTVNNETNGILTVGRNVSFTGGATASSTKVLLNNGAGCSYIVKVGGDVAVAGYLDGFGGSSTLFEINGTGPQSLTLPASTYLITSSVMNWVVDAGASLTLAGNVGGFGSFTNNGTLSFSGHAITAGGTLVLNPGGTVNGNGTNQLVSGISVLSNGGTLNLGVLPMFTGGESFTLFGAGAYSGSFDTLLPATPGGSFTWNTSQLDSAGILAVSGGAPASISFSQISGSQVVLQWPAGWSLQAQTNALSAGLSINPADWHPVTGATSPYTNAMDPASPAVFFRLVQ